nr:hypothetical protein [Tanacetum cinerariifolium]GEZ94749.1 hypothetical protein [Tanacetum cinerariifolium]
MTIKPTGVGRKECGFWTGLLRCMESKTKAPARRTYDMVNGNRKTVRPNVARFCGVHANVTREVQASGAGEEYYFAMALLDYEAKHGVPLTLHHCWEVLRKSLKWTDTKVPNIPTKKKDGKR